MATNLLRFLSSDGAQYDFFAAAPEGLDAVEARTLANAIIKEQSAARKSLAGGDSEDDSVEIGAEIKKSLSRAGFLLPGMGIEMVDTDSFDGNQTPMSQQEQKTLETWRAKQAVQAVLRQNARGEPAETTSTAPAKHVDGPNPIRLIVLPSSVDAGCDFLALAPPSLSLDDAHQLVEAVIRKKNQEDYDNDGGCDDGLEVEASIKAELTRMGFVIERAGLDVKKAIAWDDEHRVTPESENALNAWKAQQAIRRFVEQRTQESPIRGSAPHP